jgi:hypothetical protein
MLVCLLTITYQLGYNQASNKEEPTLKYDATTATTIALRGMARMQKEVSEGKYTIKVIGDGEFLIRKSDGTEYRVTVFVNRDNRQEYFGTCTCPFCDHRRENVTCKHIEFCRNLLEWDEVHRPEGSKDLQAAIAAWEEQEENAHYDRLAEEYAITRWEQQQGSYWVTGTHGDSRMAKLYAHPADEIV